MFIMPKAFPLEFRRDDAAVARKNEAPSFEFVIAEPFRYAVPVEDAQELVDGRFVSLIEGGGPQRREKDQSDAGSKGRGAEPFASVTL